MQDEIREEAALELLGKLVEIDSVNPVYGGPGERGVQRFVAEWLSARGIAFELQPVLAERTNILARIGPGDAPAVLLEAHMDTVGVEGWARGDAHQLRREGERFFGRGACDTKASLACFMLTLEFFANNADSLGKALVFAATVDEESEQHGAFELAKLKERLRLEWAITGEPTRSDVVARHKGVGRYLISTTGRAAHASTPELGENAVYAAARLCRKLERYAQELDRRPRSGEIERGTLSVGTIRGGIGFNVVPDRCVLDVDRRFRSGENADAARSELEEICESIPGAELEVFLERDPLRGENSSEFVRSLLEAGTEVGETIVSREVAYMTNAVAYEAVGIPAVVFGPGDIAQAHKNDEYIEAGQLGRCLRILKRFLSR